MPFYRRILLLLSLLILIILYLGSQRSSDENSDAQWADARQRAQGGQSIPAQGHQYNNVLPKPPKHWTSFQSSPDKPTLPGHDSPFQPGTPKSPGSTYTKAIVMGRLSTENTTWLETADLPATITKHIYDTDKHISVTSQTTPYTRLTQPKGHEAMVYLTYITTHYDTLPDISIFLHPHQHAWHNNELLNHDALEMIKRLSAEHVTREGYMNLRCHWKPGCPEYLHPQSIRADKEKPEEGAMAGAWEELFPEEALPDVLAASCCAQFAVSRARIQSVPLRRYEAVQAWLLATKLSDYVSGRVMEYLWHVLFTGQTTVCPDMRTCYCDGYGVCFEDDVAFDYWFELRYLRRAAEKKLAEWRRLVDEFAQGKKKYTGSGVGVPAVDGDVVLQGDIDGYDAMLEERRLQALEAGRDPRIRARVAGRVWRDGDGY